jgi:hypothetical protein
VIVAAPRLASAAFRTEPGWRIGSRRLAFFAAEHARAAVVGTVQTDACVAQEGSAAGNMGTRPGRGRPHLVVHGRGARSAGRGRRVPWVCLRVRAPAAGCSDQAEQGCVRARQAEREACTGVRGDRRPATARHRALRQRRYVCGHVTAGVWLDAAPAKLRRRRCFVAWQSCIRSVRTAYARRHVRALVCLNDIQV